MFENIRNNIREMTRRLEYVMTVHAVEEMENDGLTILDIENVIFSGEITERQKDYDTGEWKYLINGQSLDEHETIVVAKLSGTGKLVIITVFFQGDEHTN
jgi:ABC-type multidrug transport system ATPase subunit